MTGAPALAARTMIAMPAPSAMLRRRPVTMSWRSQSRMRDSQRSMTPMAPDVVHSIVASAMASSSGELSRVPSTRWRMSACAASGRKRLRPSATLIAACVLESSSASSAASPSATGASESTR